VQNDQWNWKVAIEITAAMYMLKPYSNCAHECNMSMHDWM